MVAALLCWRLFLLFLGAGAGAMDTHKYISDLLGNMTIDTASDTARGLAIDESHQKSGAPLMTPQQVKRMKRKYCIILMEEERPIRYKVTPPPFGRRQVGRRN